MIVPQIRPGTSGPKPWRRSRRDLGREVPAAGAELRLDLSTIEVDLDQFRAAVPAKGWSRAAGLHGGPFLEGFYLTQSPDFERWAEDERASIATEGFRVILARAGAQRGDPGWGKAHRSRVGAAQRHADQTPPVASASGRCRRSKTPNPIIQNGRR